MLVQDPVRIELPVPFPLATVNAWLFPGDEPVLVDCGVSSSLSYQQLLDGIRAAGVNPAALRLFITHGHVDHAGNARRLRDDWGVPLHAPRAEAPFVETFRRDGGTRNDDFAAALRQHGMPEADVVRMRQDSDAIDVFLDDVSISHDVADGEEVPFGRHVVQAVHTPGHTPGSVCFWMAPDNQVLTGDTLLRTITSNAVELLEVDHGRYHQYVQSLESLRRFVGCEALPGHRRPFPITDEVLDYHRDHHVRRQRKILTAATQPATAHQICTAVFPALSGDGARFMAMAEIVGHLHAAELDGLVRRQDADGVRRFVTTV